MKYKTEQREGENEHTLFAREGRLKSQTGRQHNNEQSASRVREQTPGRKKPVASDEKRNQLSDVNLPLFFFTGSTRMGLYDITHP